ncbi:preprotein translocase, partial [Oleiphilus sp. HI0078]
MNFECKLMSNKVSFTATRIKNFEIPADKKQDFLWDTKVTGFGLRCTATGTKAYILQSRIGTKAVRITIGSPKSWTLESAREEARNLQSLIDKGIDPRRSKKELIAKQEAQQEAEKQKTLKDSLVVLDAWQAYLKHHQSRWGERHYKDHVNLSQKGGEPMKRGKRKTVQGVIYPLLKMRMVDINVDELKAWQVLEAETRANNARQGYELFRAFWRWCGEQKEYKTIIDLSAVENRDLRSEVPSRKSKKFDVMQKSQVKAWFEGVQALANPVISVYLQALLLTGARRNEMASLKWSDVDYQVSALWLKDKVQEEGRKVPLTPYLRSLINSLPRRNEWVFSSPTAENGKMSEPTRA